MVADMDFGQQQVFSIRRVPNLDWSELAVVRSWAFIGRLISTKVTTQPGCSYCCTVSYCTVLYLVVACQSPLGGRRSCVIHQRSEWRIVDTGHVATTYCAGTGGAILPLLGYEDPN